MIPTANTTTRPSPVLGEATLQDLRLGMSPGGGILLRGEEGYDDARRLWNGMIDRYPALIVRCATAADVVAGVQFARSHDLVLAVRGGGHSVAGLSTCDGGLMLDLSPMKGIAVDPQRRIARAEPGVLLGELDAATQAHGLAVPAGQISHTGIAGLTLGGGLGWLMRKHGLTIDNLLAIELVTADGHLLRASTTEHPDLFWGLRGGGGNFGVVTAFEYELHPVGPIVLGGPVVYTIDKAEEVLRHWSAFMRAAPDELTSFAVLMTVPPQPPFPEALWGTQAVVVDTCWAGDIAAGERALAPLRTFDAPDLDLVGPLPFVVRQRMLDDTATPGLHFYEKSHFLAEIDRAVPGLLAHFGRVPSPRTHVILGALGGAVARPAPDATAFGHREAPYLMWAIGAWEPGADADATLDWLRDVHELTRPFSTGGVYVNALGREGASRVREAYRPGSWERLVALKTAYDPTNLFRLNQNIPPAAMQG